MLLAHCERGELMWGRLPALGRWVEMERVSSKTTLDGNYSCTALRVGCGGEGLRDHTHGGC